MPLKPMLAKDADLTKVGWPQIAQPKLDGIRAMVQDGVVLSRTLKPIPNAEVQRVLGRPEFEGFDGELIVGDPTHPEAYRRTTSFVMAPDKLWPDVQEPWTFYVFDLVNRSETPYALRYDRLRMRADALAANRVDYVRLVENTKVEKPADLDVIEADWLTQGHEGVILRDPSAAYKHGRSGKTGPLLKVKRFVDFEAVVLGVYEEQHNGNEAITNELGRTQRSSAQAGKVGKGTLGGLILSPVDDSVCDSDTVFRCGTGFDAEMRRDLWIEATCPGGVPPLHATTEGLNGRLAKIKSFPIGVKDKPRHPVFLGWRDLSVDG